MAAPRVLSGRPENLLDLLKRHPLLNPIKIRLRDARSIQHQQRGDEPHGGERGKQCGNDKVTLPHSPPMERAGVIPDPVILRLAGHFKQALQASRLARQSSFLRWRLPQRLRLSFSGRSGEPSRTLSLGAARLAAPTSLAWTQYYDLFPNLRDKKSACISLGDCPNIRPKI